MESEQDYEFDLDDSGDRVLLGSGLVGTVWRGHIKMPGMTESDGAVILPAALKCYRHPVSASPHAPQNLLREVARLGRLSHPCIVRFQRWFYHQHVPVMATELVEGISLQQLADDRRDMNVAPEEWIWQIVEWAALLASAFQHLEEHKVVHGEVKPSNIIIRETDNLPILTDFSLGKGWRNENATASIAGTSPSIPRSMFASPEQWHRRISEIEHSTDIYSLGATLWFALSGTSPPEMIPDNLQMELVPPKLAELLAAMLAQNSANRPDARHVKEALVRILEDSGRRMDWPDLAVKNLPASESDPWLPSFSQLPGAKDKWIATSLLDDMMVAYWGGAATHFNFQSGGSRIPGRVSHEQAGRILDCINAGSQLGLALYRLVDYAEWKQGAGFLEDSAKQNGRPLLHDHGPEYEWCRDHSGECVHVATLGEHGPIHHQRHPLWPKGGIRLVRERLAPGYGEDTCREESEH